MHSFGRCILLLAIILIGLDALLVLNSTILDSTKIIIYTGDSFFVPDSCKHIALLGCTPHPTSYLNLKHKEGMPLDINHLRINDFLDVDYVYDSFMRTFALCRNQSVDHLFIAYLPVYYVGMRPLLRDTFVRDCRAFLTMIVKEIEPLMDEAIVQTGYKGNVSLVVPTDNQLVKVPLQITDMQERVRYLVKQFPRLSNISPSRILKITIINNKESPEDAALANYFKYEYLFKKGLIFDVVHINKERFHK